MVKPLPALAESFGADLKRIRLHPQWVTSSAIFTFLLLGVLLRLRGLLAARSLWLDEVSLAYSVRNRGLLQLLMEPLAYGQSAPPGFLVLSRIFSELFGTGLVAIRFVPFASSVLTLFFAAAFARRALTGPYAQVAFVGGVSLSPTLIFYASEMKQYSTDALAVMLALYLATTMHDKRNIGIAAVMGLLATILSLPGLVVFGVLGLVLLGEAASRGGPRSLLEEVRARWIVFMAWTTGALVHLAYARSSGADREFMRSWWGERGGFAPDRISGLPDFTWYSERVIEIFWLALENTQMAFPGTRRMDSLAVAAAVVLVVLAVRGPRRSSLAAPLVGGIAVAAWLLAEIELYPLSSRLAIYLIPAAVAVLAMGLDAGLQRHSLASRLGAASAALLLASGLVTTAIQQFASPYSGRDMHAALEVLNRELTEGDVVVTNPRGERIIDWHRPVSNFVEPVAVIRPSRILEDLEERVLGVERPQRVWVITTHREGEAAEILEALDQQYRYTSAFNNNGIYLGIASERGPLAFVETGDRELIELLSATGFGP